MRTYLHDILGKITMQSNNAITGENNMSTTSTQTDIKALELLAESDPPRFMQMFAGIRDSAGAGEHNTLDYLHAKALATMHQFEQAESLALEMLSSALANADYLQISRCNLILSRCYAHSEDPAREKPYLDNAWEAARQARDDGMIVSCLMQLSVWHQNRGDTAKALELYAKATRHIQPEQDPLTHAKLKLGEGTIYYHGQEYDKALPLLLEALDAAVRGEDMGMQLLIINNLSTLYSLMRRFADAEEILQRGLEIANQARLVMHVLRMIFNLGTLYMRVEKVSEARDKLEECAALAASIGFADPQFIFELNNNLAGCYRYLDQPDKAVQLLDEAEEIALKTLGTDKAKELEINKANLLLSMGRVKEGRELLRSVRKYYQTHKKLSQLTLVQVNLAESYASEGKYDLALKYYRELNTTYKDYIGQLLSERSGDHKPVPSIVPAADAAKSATEQRDNIKDRIPDFVGSSRGFRRALEAGLLAAQHPNANVLITGESGTGKDVLANIIHQHSVRRGFPFVAVNVSAVTAGLIESEFFGHKKGAFTSAVSDHNGFFIQSNRGTLFLDEIGDMPVELQSKLLRALETRRITPVGATKELAFDCRVISSTNRDINEMMKRNFFRLDLFHRLNTIEIHIPPLRERPEDIEVLVRHYLISVARDTNRKVPKLEPALITALKNHPFPGNVRELRNLIERLFIFNPSDHWDADVLSSATGVSIPTEITLATPADNPALEKEAIINALMLSDGKQKDAARLLGVSESTLTRRIARLKLQVYTRKGR